MQTLAVFLFILPVLTLSADEPLFGTWVNEEYDKLERFEEARSVVYPDGRQLDYEHIADTVPVWENQLRIEETWVDASGNHWYRIRWTSWLYPSGAGKVEGYSLDRISQGGTVIEGVSAQYGYPEPEQLAPLGPNYGIMYKQR